MNTGLTVECKVCLTLVAVIKSSCWIAKRDQLERDPQVIMKKRLAIYVFFEVYCLFGTIRA